MSLSEKHLPLISMYITMSPQSLCSSNCLSWNAIFAMDKNYNTWQLANLLMLWQMELCMTVGCKVRWKGDNHFNCILIMHNFIMTHFRPQRRWGIRHITKQINSIMQYVKWYLRSTICFKLSYSPLVIPTLVGKFLFRMERGKLISILYAMFLRFTV